MAAAKGCWQASIRTLWAIAKSPELHMEKDDVYAVVYRETGKTSIKALSQGELNKVCRVLQNLKDGVSGKSRPKRTDEGGNPKTEAMRRKIHALCVELGWNENPKRIQGFVKRMTKIERIEWLNQKQCGVVIEVLKAMVARQEEGNADAEKV